MATKLIFLLQGAASRGTQSWFRKGICFLGPGLVYGNYLWLFVQKINHAMTDIGAPGNARNEIIVCVCL